MRILLLALAATGGCAHQMPNEPPPAHRRKGAEGPLRMKLAILPVESDAFPRLASGLNALLHDVQLKGIDDYFLSKVTLEVVQLSIECVEQNSNCYSAVGKSMEAQRILLAHIVAGPVSAASKAVAPRKKGARPPRSVKVSITLFDVDNGSSQKESEKQFATEDEAAAGLADLMQQTIGEFTPTATTARAPEAKGK